MVEKFLPRTGTSASKVRSPIRSLVRYEPRLDVEMFRFAPAEGVIPGGHGDRGGSARMQQAFSACWWRGAPKAPSAFRR